MARLRRYLASVLLLSVFNLPIAVQQTVDNPAKPLNPNAGRVVALRESIRITDEGTDQYYFEYPQRLHIAPNGSIFVLDREQLLQFSQEGKFIANYFKKGQGPGELNYVSDFVLTEKNLIVQNANPNKIVWFDFSGNLVKDTAVPYSGGSLQILLLMGEDYYFKKAPFPPIKEMKGMEAVFDNPQTVSSWREGAEQLRDLGIFPTQWYLRKSEHGGGGILPMVKFISIPNQKILFISHTPEYLVKALDVEDGSVSRLIRRLYERVKSPPELKEGIQGGAIVNGKPLVAPAPKYDNDIVNLFIHADDLWVATSTIDKEKGTLIDVFNSQGYYVDCFYVKLPKAPYKHLERPAPQVIAGDYLFAIEKNPDETYMIKKYKIEL
jgi:hypothetical protein